MFGKSFEGPRIRSIEILGQVGQSAFNITKVETMFNFLELQCCPAKPDAERVRDRLTPIWISQHDSTHMPSALLQSSSRIL